MNLLKSRLNATVFIGLSSLLSTTTSAADDPLQAAVNQYTSCLDEAIQIEKYQDAPSFSTVLAGCTDPEALIKQLLPGDISTQLMAHIHKIAEQRFNQDPTN